MEQDELVRAETGHKLVEREAERFQERAHLADVIELSGELLGVLERQITGQEGDAESVGGGDKLLVREAPGESFSGEPDTEDGANGAINEGLLKRRAWSCKLDADGGTELLINGGEDWTRCGAGGGDNGSVIQSTVDMLRVDGRFSYGDIESGVAQSVV